MADITGIDYNQEADFGMTLEEAGHKGGKAAQAKMHSEGRKIGFAAMQEEDPERLHRIAHKGGKESQKVQHDEGRKIGFQNLSHEQRQHAGHKGGKHRAQSRDVGEKSGPTEEDVGDRIGVVSSGIMPPI